MADSISYLIANHRIRVAGDDVAAMLRTMPGFPVFEHEDGEPEWLIEFGHKIEKPAQWTELYHFVFEIEMASCSFAKTDDAYYFIMEPAEPTATPLLMRYSGGNVVEAIVDGGEYVVGIEQDGADTLFGHCSPKQGSVVPWRVGYG